MKCSNMREGYVRTYTWMYTVSNTQFPLRICIVLDFLLVSHSLPC